MAQELSRSQDGPSISVEDEPQLYIREGVHRGDLWGWGCSGQLSGELPPGRWIWVSHHFLRVESRVLGQDTTLGNRLGTRGAVLSLVVRQPPLG